MYEVSLSLGVDSQDRKFDGESVRANGLQSMKGITEDSDDRATFVLAVMLRKNVVVCVNGGARELSNARSAKPVAIRGPRKNRLIAR
jgi:hypothetical protein